MTRHLFCTSILLLIFMSCSNGETDKTQTEYPSKDSSKAVIKNRTPYTIDTTRYVKIDSFYYDPDDSLAGTEVIK